MWDAASENLGFKPYYNWNAFNTIKIVNSNIPYWVLNLIITGMPSIPIAWSEIVDFIIMVLNLIITGMPSILKLKS